MKGFLSGLILLFIVCDSEAQTFNRIYTGLGNQHTANGAGDITAAHSYGFIAAGSGKDSSISLPLIIRLDNCGDTVWHKLYSSYAPNLSGFYKIIKCNDGNYFTLAALGTSSTILNRRILLTKIDTSGNILWYQVYSSSLDLTGTDIVQNSFGEILITGSVYSPFHAFLLKADASGNQLWIRIYAGSYQGKTVKVLSNNLYAVLNRKYQWPNSWSSIMLSDSAGNLVGDFMVANSGKDEYPVNFFPLSDGSFIIAGQRDEEVMYSLHVDHFVSRVSSTGALIWQTVTGQNHINEVASCAAMLTDSTIVVAGQENQNGGTPRGYCSVVDLNGTLIRKTYYYPAHSAVPGGNFGGIEETPGGGYIMSGRSSSNMDPQLDGAWIVIVDSTGNDNVPCSPVSVEIPVIDSKQNDDISICSNPVGTLLIFTLNRSQNISVINTAGEILLEKSLVINGKKKAELNVSTLSPGMYFLKAGNDVRKFVKE